MKLLTIARTSLAALAVVALASCSLTQSADTAPNTQAPTSAPAETTSAPQTSEAEQTSATEETSAEETSAEPTGEAKEACAALTADEMNAALGTKFGKGTGTTAAGYTQCQYTDMTTGTVAVVQVIPQPVFDQYVSAMTKQMGSEAKTEKATVPGADQAAVITGKVGGFPGSSIVVGQGNIVGQVMVASPAGKAPASAALVKAATALLA
ncbi:hypothetical protein ACSDQ9_00855 [Aestuariimicrobium soli]|uniref:hypothetical protein n=1 Tax=Aestuariimicrobium soli TaxID=2035834 RepID=UPI003EBFD5AF